ncbi:hypothetical protein [Microbulbifer sp. JMSA008]|uniref:hypothetical protein n=1 Tax=Microbulbifer sp. JMSA008 TaxID=3243373 RepID=UPI00403982AE
MLAISGWLKNTSQEGGILAAANRPRLLFSAGAVQLPSMESTMYKVLLSVALMAMISSANAQPRKPPQEAFDACKAMSKGDACKVETPHGSLEGTCRMPPREEQLVCVPTKMEGRRPGKDRKENNE